MESLECSVLEKHRERLTASGVDPVPIACKLRVAEIIADEDLTNILKDAPASERWGELVTAITKSSSGDTFQKLIDVLLKEEKLKHLGKEMNDAYSQGEEVATEELHQSTGTAQEASRGPQNEQLQPGEGTAQGASRGPQNGTEQLQPEEGTAQGASRGSQNGTEQLQTEEDTPFEDCKEELESSDSYELPSDTKIMAKKAKLPSPFWLTVFQKQLGVTSEKAMKHVGAELYPHLVQFAKTQADKEELQEYLQVEGEKITFKMQREHQREKLKTRQSETDSIVQELDTLTKQGKHRHQIKQVENDLRESLQIPADFWPFKTTSLKDIIVQLKAFKLKIRMELQNNEMNDASVVSTASEACALRGILLTQQLHSLLQRRQVLLKAPNSVCLMAPSHTQHVITKQFESWREEKVFVDTVKSLGYSVAGLSVVDFVGIPFEILSVHCQTTKKDQFSEQKTYCSTVQYFVMPLASCYFRTEELQLSDDAIRDLKTIENLIDSNDMSLQDKCKEFFQKFGSHVSKGPLHFGGTYMWKTHSFSFKSSEGEKVQQRQSDLMKKFASKHVFHHPKSVPYSEAYDGDITTSQSFKVVATSKTSGGPQGVIGLSGWKNGLIASNNAWTLIDRGMTLMSVWDIITSNHKEEFENLSSLAAQLKEAWSKMVQDCFEQDKEDPVGNVASITHTLTSWKSTPDVQQCLKWLQDLAKIKQNITEESMNPCVWPAVYLSKPEVKRVLKLVVDKYFQQSHSERKSIAEIRLAVKEVVEPLDLDTVKDSQWKKHISSCVYSTESTLITLECKNVLRLLKYFQCALAHMHVGPEKQDTLIEVQPGTNNRVTAALANVVWCYANYLRKVGQKYEEAFIVTMLLPFSYDSVQHVFSASFSFCDLKYFCEKFGQNCQDFFNVMKQENVLKSQTYLFLLALEMHKDLHTSKSNIMSCLQGIEQRIGNDIDQRIAKALLDLHSSTRECEWLQSQLQRICSEDEIEKKFAKRKQEFEQFFSVLGLKHLYPQKLTLRRALVIRKDTLESVKHLHDTHGTAANDKSISSTAQCRDPKLYPFLILQQIMAFDFRCRAKLVLTSDLNGPSIQMLGAGRNVTEHVVHPMDGLLAILHCADSFLRQDLIQRLATCQLAVPLLLPDPTDSQKLTFLLWAMRSIVREWQLSNGDSREGPLVSYPSPLVSYLRIGKLKVSKSRIVNTIINESGHNIFCNFDSDGGSARHLFLNGVVEVSWYLPSKNESIFPDLVTFANLRGDACECSKQVEFLSKVSFMNFVFINKDNLDEEVLHVLEKLSAAPAGLVLLHVGSLDDDWWHDWIESKKHSVKTIDLERKGQAEIAMEVRKDIRSKLIDVRVGPPKNSSLEDHSNAARSCDIFVDEDEQCCVEGKKSAVNFEKCIKECRDKRAAENFKSLLSLQGQELWQKWALAEKEQYRQTRREQCEVEVYVSQQRKIMNDIRKKQVDKIRSLPSFMSSFLTSITTHQGKTRQYFLHWMRLLLDNLAREQLSSLNMQYKQSTLELGDIQSQGKRKEGAEQALKDKIQKLNNKIIESSFGLENLLREVSQMYEAVTAQKKEGVSQENKLILGLPEVAANLLIEGYPLELMDGDAAHVPITWVSAVLTKVQEELKDLTVLVLSVLGVQSSGKSTLLNTVFGVRFTASAGRCTRGAFMQLLPIHENFQQECKCNYILIVDTEGLRAPELEQQTHKHDNQLATFVIGLANQTIINLSGETMGDMDDILQTAVHAFLRMKTVKLKPSCHFVHQNVAAVTAEEKARAGRLKFTNKLDEITKVAAKQEGKEEQYTCFKDLIDFDCDKHVFYFQNLWKGDPPMAPVNPGYSTSAQFLKLCLLTYAKQIYPTQLSVFQKHLKELWKAILHENFVFSFKNTLEIMAYNTLDKAYSEWSWCSKQEMMTWEHTTHNKIRGCEMSKLSTVYEECRRQLPQHVQKVHKDIKEKMDVFFKSNTQKEILIKWKGETTNRIESLMRQLQQQAENHCKFWKTNREDLAKIDEMKETHRRLILDQVKLLASQLEKGKLKDEELEERFSEKWTEWIKDIRFQRMDEVKVKEDVEQCLTTFVPLKSSLPMIFEKLTTKPLEEWGLTLHLQVRDEHVKPRISRIPFLKVPYASVWPVKDGQQCTDRLLKRQNGHIEKIKQRPYHSDLASHLLHELFNDISSSTTAVGFTDEYKVDMALTVCGYAVRILQDMADTEREKNDPVTYLEREMRELLLKIFKDEYNQTAREVTAASAICDLLQHSVRNEVHISLSQRVADGMRGVYTFLHSKPSLKLKILLDIGDKLDKKTQGCFEDCLLYLTDVEKSLHSWLEHYTIQYCNEGKFAEISNTEILKCLGLITDTVSRVCMEYKQKASDFRISEWLTDFHCGIQSTGMLRIDATELQQLAGGNELTDVDRFTTEVMSGLRVLECTLKEEFENLPPRAMSDWKVKPYDHLFEALAGCTEQCPFCMEQCDLTNPSHCSTTKHSVEMHRPKCLGGYSYEGSNEMVLELCTTAVGTDDYKFKNPDTNGEYHLYKEYTKIYPQWSITADLSHEASLYWKWLLGHYANEVAQAFNMRKARIPTEWEKLQWSDIKKELMEKHNM